MYNSPIELYQEKPYKLFIKREDLLPKCFGGNKLRIAEEYIKDMYKECKDCMVAYGNPRSNLCRTLSMICYSLNIPCFILSPDEGNGERVESFNKKLSLISKANIISCDKNNVSFYVEKVLSDCRNKGYNPYYIYGDIFGKGNEGTPVEAYYQVYLNELDDFIKRESIGYIFLPVGTGMTIAGLIVARNSLCGNEKIVGISIARERENARESIDRYCKSFVENKDLDIDYSNYTILDDYIMGGYGKYSNDLNRMILDIYCKHGLEMDPTYVGKGFYGMNDWLLNNNIRKENVLFIHTGGTPLWFDFINSLD